MINFCIFYFRILVKGERDNNIFSGKPQPLNQDYFKTLWGRFKRQSNLLEQDQTLYSFRHSGAIEIFKRTGSITKRCAFGGAVSINCINSFRSFSLNIYKIKLQV